MTKHIIAGAAALAIFGIVAPAAADWADTCSCSTFGGNGSFGSPARGTGRTSASIGAKHGVSGHANQFPGVSGREKRQWGNPFSGPIGPNFGNEQWHRDRHRDATRGGSRGPGVDDNGFAGPTR